MKIIYLDNGASTKVDSKVVESMLPFFEKSYANASSTHYLGQEAKRVLGESRDVIAKSIQANSDEIIFTSGGTESNNLTIKGAAFALKDKGKHIITTKIEHSSVLATCKWLESQGFNITYLNVDKEGFINLKDLEKAISPETILVSIIHGNNEIGTIQNLDEMGGACQKHDVYFHTDACQSYTKVPINVKKQAVDLISLNAHKIHGPKGVGALYIKNGIKIIPLAHGGGHEKNLRSGTENIPGIVGFGRAVKLAQPKHINYMADLRDKLIKKILEAIPDAKINGPIGDKRLCNNINICFPVDGEILGDYLNSKGICTSKGSACSAGESAPSHVLLALGRSPEEANNSLRLTISRFTTEEEIDYTSEVLTKTVEKLRKPSLLEKIIQKV